MGAWGHGIYDNDSALDFLGDVISTSFEMAEYNEDYLVVADMIKNNTSSTKEQANKIKEVIQEELNNLPNWVKDAQEPRKQVLKELLMWFENDKNIIC